VLAFNFIGPWRDWLIALSAPLHGRLAWRLTTVVAGMIFASGRRTVSSWWRAARVGSDFRSYYYFLDSVGRKTQEVAAVLLKIVLERIDVGDRIVFAIDDTPAKRYGPKVQGGRLQARRLSEVQVLVRVFRHHVTQSNCVAARRGGEQLAVNDQPVTHVNSIRPLVVASLLSYGEAQVTHGLRERGGPR
jgi:hypothetical protein